MELKDLLGEHKLSGVEFGKIEKNEYDWEEPSTVDFILDGKIISAIENPDDGYRSTMRELLENRPGAIINNKFKAVRVLGIFRSDSNYEKNEIVDFIDIKTGKIVLSVGTGNTDDYYPYFVGQWSPENLCLNVASQDGELKK